MKIKIDELFDGLAEQYLDNIRNDIQKMRNFLHDSDFQKITQITHQMKGSGKSFGFDFITNAGELLEQAAREEKGDTVEKGLNDLAMYLDTVEILFVPEEEL